MKKISIIDSHTGGEPTRLIMDGGPDLGSGPLSERLLRLQTDFDHYRTAAICEPRGSDVMVGALACEPYDQSCTAAVIFFNNVGYLGMCGHGMIGFVTSLAYKQKIVAGSHRIETPVGVVTAELHADHSVTINNVPAYRYRKEVAVEVAEFGTVTGDIAWGGNWFFLVSNHRLALNLSNVDKLTEFSWKIRQALENAGITGEDRAIIDHVELFGAAVGTDNDSRNFVLCPGIAYDRSPCGTGTSAKLACLASDDKLKPGEIWRQESIIGSVFEGSYQRVGDKILPSIRGHAYVNAESNLLLDERDPFIWGFV